MSRPPCSACLESASPTGSSSRCIYREHGVCALPCNLRRRHGGHVDRERRANRRRRAPACGASHNEWLELHRDELQHELDSSSARGLRWSESSPFRRISGVDIATHLSRITNVKVIGDHRLHLVFEDGVGGEIDAAGWEWRGVFEPLQDPSYFARVELDEDLGAIGWPNGADVALRPCICGSHRRPIGTPRSVVPTKIGLCVVNRRERPGSRDRRDLAWMSRTRTLIGRSTVSGPRW